jgi:hypothetical protein
MEGHMKKELYVRVGFYGGTVTKRHSVTGDGTRTHGRTFPLRFSRIQPSRVKKAVIRLVSCLPKRSIFSKSSAPLATARGVVLLSVET